MKKGWEYKTLGEVCEVINGLWKGKKEPFINVGVIRNANFTKDFTLRYDNIEWLNVEERQYSKRKLQSGDLIVEKSGGSEKQPVGRTVLFDKSEGEYSFSNFTSVLRIKGETIKSKFLFYYLFYVYQRGDTKSMQKATTGIHNIEMDKYLSINIPIPPLSEQEEIVSRLDKAFEQIDTLRRNAEQSLTTAQQLFQSTLTHLLTPQPHWERKTLKDIGKTQTGSTPSMSHIEYYGDYMPFIKPSEVNHDGIGGINYDTQCLSELGAEHGRIFEAGSIFMVCIGATISKTGISNRVISCNQQINVITPFKGYANKYIYYSLCNPIFKSIVIEEGTSSQATLPIISKGKWEVLTIDIPPLPEQSAIVAKLDSLSSKVKQLKDNYTRTVALCNEMKQALLKEVFED